MKAPVMTNARPLVSVIVPCWNSERFIDAALASLMHEPGVALDIIVVDDGSCDSTRAIIADWEKRASCLRLIKSDHLGIPRARNIARDAIDQRASFVTCLDSDDVNAPGRISRQVGLLLRQANAAAAIGLTEVFSADATLNHAPPAKAILSRGVRVQLGSVTFRRSSFMDIGPFDETMTVGSDLDFYFRFLEKDPAIVFENETAVYYRRHQASATIDPKMAAGGILRAAHKSLKRRGASPTSPALARFIQAVQTSSRRTP